MVSAHTPGPWVRRLDANEQINIYGGENEQAWIAILPHQGVRSIEEEQKRNAKLISAAPDLADQLEEALGAMRAMRAAAPSAAMSIGLLDCIDSSRAALHAAGRDVK